MTSSTLNGRAGGGGAGGGGGGGASCGAAPVDAEAFRSFAASPPHRDASFAPSPVSAAHATPTAVAAAARAVARAAGGRGVRAACARSGPRRPLSGGVLPRSGAGRDAREGSRATLAPSERTMTSRTPRPLGLSLHGVHAVVADDARADDDHVRATHERGRAAARCPCPDPVWVSTSTPSSPAILCSSRSRRSTPPTNRTRFISTGPFSRPSAARSHEGARTRRAPTRTAPPSRTRA